MVTLSPATETSGRRKCRNAATMAIHEASINPPSASKTCTSARIDQHLAPAIMHNDSVSIALDLRMAFSRIREITTSCSVGLFFGQSNQFSSVHRNSTTRSVASETYLPTSNAGDAMGLSSVVIVKTPSNLRSSSGLVTSADICTWTLAGVHSC